MELNEKYKVCIPWIIGEKYNLKTKAAMDCWALILLNGMWSQTLKNIQITRADMNFLHLNRFSYMRGIKTLEKRGWIVVNRKPGCKLTFTIVKDKQPQEMIDFILKGKGTTT